MDERIKIADKRIFDTLIRKLIEKRLHSIRWLKWSRFFVCFFHLMQLFYHFLYHLLFFRGEWHFEFTVSDEKKLIIRHGGSAESYVNKGKTVENASYDTLIHDFDTLIRKFPVYEKIYAIVVPSTGGGR